MNGKGGFFFPFYKEERRKGRRGDLQMGEVGEHVLRLFHITQLIEISIFRFFHFRLGNVSYCIFFRVDALKWHNGTA
jgi:hypothetical protein